MQMELVHGRRRGAGWIVVALLLLAVSAKAWSSEACLANFTHGGDIATGLTFSTSRTIPGLSPQDAIDQYKHIAAAQGFKIGRDKVRHGQGELVISQLPSINAAGFDMHVVASEDGKVAVSTTLPQGLSATPKAFSDNMCEALDQLGTGSAMARGTAAGDAPVFAPSPQQRTDLCLANFASQGSSVEGRTYSTWSIGMAMDVSAAVARIKQFVRATPDARLTTEVIHGTRASLTLSLGTPALTEVSVLPMARGVRDAFPIRIDLDASLNAASFTAHLNPEQAGVNGDQLDYIGCTMIAAAVSGTPIPLPKKASRFHFHNPFKNEKKAAQKKYDAQIDLMRSGRTLLYKRALRAGKAIVFLPMLNVEYKYAHADIKSMSPGGDSYPALRFDQTANLVWHAVDDHNNLLKVGEQVTLWQEGLFGAIQTMTAGKSRYGIYIVDPGSYELAGLTYQLPHTTLPPLSSKRWSEHPDVGVASFAITRNAEFHDAQAWFDARFQDVTVDDSYCALTRTPGSDAGCVSWVDASHVENRLVDPGGWRTVTEKSYAGGVAVSVKLNQPFARFEARAGQVLVTDGFAVTPDSLAADPGACHQVGENLIDCVFRSLTLFRIPGKLDDLAISADTARQVPMAAGFIARAQYRPLAVYATRLEETPGTYEAAWANPYRVPLK